MVGVRGNFQRALPSSNNVCGRSRRIRGLRRCGCRSLRAGGDWVCECEEDRRQRRKPEGQGEQDGSCSLEFGSGVFRRHADESLSPAGILNAGDANRQ